MGKTWLILCLTIVLLLTGFIYYNSAKSSERSHQTSNKVEEILLESTSLATVSSLDHLIRKAAHLLEYALLGTAVAGTVWLVHRLYRNRMIGFGCLYLLLAAVADEYIQSFFGRTSQVSDILLDFAGALIGFSLLYAVCVWHTYRKSKRSLCPGKE